MSIRAPFTPSGSSVAIASSGSFIRRPITTEADQVLIQNTQSQLVGGMAFYRLGDSTVEATVNDTPLGPRESTLVSRSPDKHTHLAVISDGTALVVYLTPGQGADPMKGRGGDNFR
jgi:hypothetical protein